MYIKELEYETIATRTLNSYINWIKQTKEINESMNIDYKYPTKINIHEAITKFLPDKYQDDTTTPLSYWTKHNERKLYKYIELEIKRKMLTATLKN